MPDHYGTLEDANEYHAARGNARWAASTDDYRLAALVRASQALDGLYGPRFPGTVANAAQELLWPRKDLTFRGASVPVTEVPVPVIRATYELALRELVSPGSIAPDLPAGPQKVLTEVKGIKWTVVGGAGFVRAVLPLVEGMLEELLIAAPAYTQVTTLARL